MRAFYRDVVGLEVLEDFAESGMIFFRIAPGYSGHTTVLALFDKGADIHPRATEAPETGARSSLHHIALTVDYADQDPLIAYLTGMGLNPNVQDFPWIGWRGVFITDPEGNTVEFVAGVPIGEPL